jgi:subtilisin family serine protease
VVGVRRLITLLAVVGAMLVLYAGGVLAQEAPQDRGAEPYIVVFKGETVAKPGQAASAMARRDNLEVGFVYRHALEGFSAVIPQTKLDEVRADSRVKYIEQDGKMHAFAQTLPWGIDKIDADSSSTKAGDGTGAITNVNAYVIDTGIDAGHTDLNVTRNVNFTGGPNTDCNGHGTHVAGTVAAKDNAQEVVGGAPGAPLTGVKVLGCSGSGSNSGVIAGIDWVTTNAASPAVANMSLGGGVSQAVDDAVTRSANSGITYAVAAGNDAADACNHSPARAGKGTNNGIITVAATDSSDREASFSNYGNCVDTWAPGVSVVSTRKGGGTTTMSGTSMASPHVAGGAALYLSKNPGASATSVESAIKNAAVSTSTLSKDKKAIKREYVGGF